MNLPRHLKFLGSILADTTTSIIAKTVRTYTARMVLFNSYVSTNASKC